MTKTTTPVAPVQNIVLWLREKLAEANRGLAAREQAESTWRGNDNEWSSEMNAPTKAERLKIADRESRIAKKYRRDVEAITHLLTIVDQ